MDYTKRLLVLFQQRATRFIRHLALQRPDALENSLLARLPTELLQHVANNLPVASAASFSLSCRQIYLLTGTQYVENLATSDHETLVFLKLVEHDLQNQIVCNSCRKLHKIKDARKYTERGQPFFPAVEPDCLFDDREAMVTWYIHENFSTIVFKMAMKHYHNFGYDAQSRKLLNLLSVKSRAEAWDTLVGNYKAECQIKNGSLFTCQHIAFHGTCTDVKEDLVFFWICPHLECKSRGRSASLCITTSRRLQLDEKWSMLLHRKNSTNIKMASRHFYSELHQYRYCRTEYKAGFKHDDGCTMKFTMTIWEDLGQGPEAEEWKAHVVLEGSLSFPQPIQFYGGEIASVFLVRGAKLGQR